MNELFTANLELHNSLEMGTVYVSTHNFTVVPVTLNGTGPSSSEFRTPCQILGLQLVSMSSLFQHPEQLVSTLLATVNYTYKIIDSYLKLLIHSCIKYVWPLIIINGRGLQKFCRGLRKPPSLKSWLIWPYNKTHCL